MRYNEKRTENELAMFEVEVERIPKQLNDMKLASVDAILDD